ncbi:MAG: SRPBCC family protein [Actinobacteria bacterium]|nr:MAG: SRPBCC family protein [Actinomycetota bacterium]
MAKDVGDLIGTAIGRVARETVQSVAANNKKRGNGLSLSGGRGLAAGAGLASLAPIAFKGAKNLASGSSNGSNPISKAKEKLEGGVRDKAKQGAKDALPFGGGKDKGEPGVGKGRRMPIQQSMDVPVPVKTAYNEWTQFEEWPEFMHRLQSVSQEDDTHLTFKAKIWGKSKEFKVEIEEQRPDERIKWKVVEGMTHTGVVTFHEVAPRLTRIELNMDVQPGSLVEKAARGMRHIKRAVRADMHRFKAHVMMADEEHGAWRGTIDEGKVKRARSRSTSRSSGSRSTSRSSGSRSTSRASSGSSSSRSRSSSSNGRSSASRSSRSSASNGRKKSGSRS